MPRHAKPPHEYRFFKRNSLHAVRPHWVWTAAEGAHGRWEPGHNSYWKIYRDQNRMEPTYPAPLPLPNRRNSWRFRRQWEKQTQRGRRYGVVAI